MTDNKGYSKKLTLPIGYLFQIFISGSGRFCNSMMVCGYINRPHIDSKCYYAYKDYKLSHDIYIGGHNKPMITVWLNVEGQNEDHKCYIVKPLDPQRFQELLCAIDPGCIYSSGDIARFYPRVENQPWFSVWVDSVYIPEEKVIRPITGTPELLWPFLQHIPEDKILDRVTMFNIACKNKVEFPLDMNVVECVLLMGEKVKLIVGNDIVREGKLKIRQLDGYYQLI